jgi:hypothetical protein
MMNNDAKIRNAFSQWKILLAITFGLSVSVGLLIYTFNQAEFKQVKTGTGTHVWTDLNNNGIIDHTGTPEFKLQPGGDYSLRSAWEILGDIDWSVSTFFWLFLAIFGMVGRDAAYMWRMRILTHNELSWRQTFSVIMLWEFASALAPGVVSGATVAMFILNHERIAMGRATAIVVITAFLDNLFYVVMIPLVVGIVGTVSLFPTSISDTNASTVFWTGYGIFTALCLVLYLSIFRFPNLIKRILEFVCSFPLLTRWKENASRTGDEIATTARIMRQEKGIFWVKTFVATCASWTSRFLVINFIMQAFLQLGLLQQLHVLSKQFVLWMFLRVSPTPGGSGVAEWAFGELMSDLTTSFILLGAMAVIWRLISYFPYLVIGSFILPRWLKRKK